jgi:hypothetical protein
MTAILFPEVVMVLELFAQANPNDAAFKVGQIIGIIIAMLLSVSIPISFGASRDQLGLGIVGGVCAAPAALFLGCLGGLPVALLFVGIIAAVTSGGGTRKKKRKKKPRQYDDEDDYDRPRRSRRQAYDEADDDDDRPRRRSRRDDEDDDDEEDRPRRRRRDDD